MNGSLGRRYAKALIGLAREQSALASAGEDLARAAEVFAQGDLRRVVLNPGIAAATRRAVASSVIDRLGISPIVGNLVRLLADRDRLDVLPDVARAYQALVDRELGRARVTIRSAAPLTDGQAAELEQLAKRLTGRPQVIVRAVVDPTLIGGVMLDASGTVYDGSVKTQLARLAKAMAGPTA